MLLPYLPTSYLTPEKKIGAQKIYCMELYDTIQKSYLKKKILHAKYLLCGITVYGTIDKSYLKNKLGAPNIYYSKVQYYDTIRVHELKSTITLGVTGLPTDLPTYRTTDLLPSTFMSVSSLFMMC